MYKNVEIIILKTVTPVHAGSGRELGLIDMPIQKESHTGIPKIEGSSVKGCMREACRLTDKANVEELFGSEEGNTKAGLIGFSDAKLLLYPIKSLKNVFEYVTCPYLINRFIEDLEVSKEINSSSAQRNNLEIIDSDFISEGKALVNEGKIGDEDVILDMYRFKIQNSEEEKYEKILENIRKKLQINRNIVMISDSDFIELLTLSKEIITRNQINVETGTVDEKKGGLFTEEYLPSESVLYSLFLVNGILNDGNKIVENYKKSFPKIIQVGGNSNIGKGIVKVGFSKKLNGGDPNEQN